MAFTVIMEFTTAIHNGFKRLSVFLGAMLRRFIGHGGLERAGSLAYTTLLSLVPLMTVMFAIMSAFPVADRLDEVVQNFIFDNFVPASGEVIHQHLTEFMDKASNLSGVGFIALLVVALMMISTIDQTFNAIWDVQQKRSALNKFLVYWAVLSMGPLFVGASVLLSSYLISLPLVNEATATDTGRRLLNWLPTVMSGTAFIILYWLVPNRPVKLRHAIMGGILAAVLFEWVKDAFAWYVTTFPTYQAIYGAMAAIPIFLIWIYLSWLVVLLGAEFTHALGMRKKYARFGADKGGELEAMLHLLLNLATAHKKGEALSLHQLTRCCANAEALMARLQAMQLVQRNDRGHWLLAKDPREISLYQLYLDAGRRLPVPGEPAWPHNPELSALYQSANECLSPLLDLSLDGLMANGSGKQ